MPAPCLHDLEKTMRVLWMDRKLRQRYLDATSGDGKVLASDIDGLTEDFVQQVDRQGVQLYASLINHGQQELMRSVYPGCAKLVGDKWNELVDKFLEYYPPKHYNLNQAARNFSEFLGKYAERYCRKFPFIEELADYEWLELELMENPLPVQSLPPEELDSPEKFAQLCPVVNPVARIVHYSYPIPAVVERLRNESRLPKNVDPQPTCVVVYRDPFSHECRFLELEATAANLVETAQKRATSYKDLLALAMQLSGADNAQQTVVEFLELMEKLGSLNLVVGSVASG